MRRHLIIASLAGSFGIFALTSGLFEQLFMFILFGTIPGTNKPLPASVMMALWCLLFSGFCASWVGGISQRFNKSFSLSRQDRTA